MQILIETQKNSRNKNETQERKKENLEMITTVNVTVCCARHSKLARYQSNVCVEGKDSTNKLTVQ